MQHDNDLLMQGGLNPLTSTGNQLAGEVHPDPVHVQANDRNDEQGFEGQIQAIDVTETIANVTPANSLAPIPHGMPNDDDNNVSTVPGHLNMNEYSNIQDFAIQYPHDPYYGGFDLSDQPSFSDSTSFLTGANNDFDIPQQGLNAQFDGQQLDESWFYVDPSLREPQNNLWMRPQGYDDSFQPPVATHQHGAYTSPNYNSGLLQDEQSLNPAYDDPLTTPEVSQQHNIPAATQVVHPPKRGPGRPQGGRLPEGELMNRIPIQYSGTTRTTKGDNKDLDSGEEASNEAVGTKQGKRQAASKTPTKRTRSSTNASQFIKIRPDMTDQEMKAAANHNQSVQLERTKADRARNNMSAKRGRYRRMACTVSVLDEVIRLNLEVRRVHEELEAERTLNSQLVHQLESAGIPPALPSLPVATGLPGTGTVHNAVAVQRVLADNANVPQGSSDAPSTAPVSAVVAAYGRGGNGKFKLATDDLAIDEAWFSKAETTRKELMKDLPKKVAALDGDLLEEMQDVVDKGNMIRALVADHDTIRATIQEQPHRHDASPSTPVSSNTTSVKRKTTSIFNDLDQTEDDDRAMRRSTGKSAKFN